MEIEKLVVNRFVLFMFSIMIGFFLLRKFVVLFKMIILSGGMIVFNKLFLFFVFFGFGVRILILFVGFFKWICGFFLKNGKLFGYLGRNVFFISFYGFS